MKEIVVGITKDGSIRFLIAEETKVFASEEPSVTKRASHVEPENLFLRFIFHCLRYLFGDKGWMAKFTRLWPCLWRVNLIPSGGPILEELYSDRLAAIEAEIIWLNENFL